EKFYNGISDYLTKIILWKLIRQKMFLIKSSQPLNLQKMNKGFAHIFLLTGAIFVLLGGAWLLKNKKSNTTIESPISSTSPDIYTNENPDNWKTFTYENEKLSFHLKHPQEWIAMTLADNPY